jgi:hypothetical protein
MKILYSILTGLTFLMTIPGFAHHDKPDEHSSDNLSTYDFHHSKPEEHSSTEKN